MALMQVFITLLAGPATGPGLSGMALWTFVQAGWLPRVENGIGWIEDLGSTVARDGKELQGVLLAKLEPKFRSCFGSLSVTRSPSCV